MKIDKSTKTTTAESHSNLQHPTNWVNYTLVMMLLFAIFVSLGLTNPTKEEYLEHVVWKLKNITCRQANLEASTQVFCTSLSILPLSMSAQILSGYIHRQNYILLSIYKLDAFEIKDCSVGMGKQFF